MSVLRWFGLLGSINDKYLEALKAIGEWTTVSLWLKFAEIYSDLLENAERHAAGQKNETTGLREIAARISSKVARGTFGNQIEVDATERPKRVRWVKTIY